MTTETERDHPSSGSLTAAISTAIVKLMRDYTGRGPMKARTTIRDNVVLVMLELRDVESPSTSASRCMPGTVHLKKANGC